MHDCSVTNLLILLQPDEEESELSDVADTVENSTSKTLTETCNEDELPSQEKVEELYTKPVASETQRNGSTQEESTVDFEKNNLEETEADQEIHKEGRRNKLSAKGMRNGTPDIIITAPSSGN